MLLHDRKRWRMLATPCCTSWCLTNLAPLPDTDRIHVRVTNSSKRDTRVTRDFSAFLPLRLHSHSSEWVTWGRARGAVSAPKLPRKCEDGEGSRGRAANVPASAASPYSPPANRSSLLPPADNNLLPLMESGPGHLWPRRAWSWRPFLFSAPSWVQVTRCSFSLKTPLTPTSLSCPPVYRRDFATAPLSKPEPSPKLKPQS